MKTWQFALCLFLAAVGLAACAPPAPAIALDAHWRAPEVIEAFREYGLQAQVMQGATKQERDGLSGIYVVETRRFRISDKENELGMVLSFAKPDELRRMEKYYADLNRTMPQFRSWIFVQDNVLLQINHEVPEKTARAYATVLNSLGKFD
jgi:hypothetical protein